MLRLAGIDIDAVSVAGLETCIQLPGLSLAFDLGICPRSAVKLPTVFFTHAHVDHMAGVIHHVATRGLQRMKPPTYVMPERNVADFRAMLDCWRRLDGSALDCELVGLAPGHDHRLRADLVARPVATPHRVVSQGYVLWEQRQKLRPSLRDRTAEELRALRRAGQDVTETVETPLVAFTGDSRIEAIDHHEALRRARLLIMEVTFLDERVDVERTRAKGHIHLDEVVARADRFENEAILLTHLSARYSAEQALRILDRRLPRHLRERVTLLAAHNAGLA
ncbi:MAG: metal-dependent hydrolase [Alphaproteobacteria bacterium]|nr:metal-dependent hydrolase [Alphaproteobacteria bacterium]